MKYFLLLFLFLPNAALAGYAQDSSVSQLNQPVDLSNVPGRAAHGFTNANEDNPARNFGTGFRVSMEWADVRTAVQTRTLPVSAFAVGVFHQYALGRVGSVQGEASYFQRRGARGIQLPVLLVINVLDNISVQVGPQAEWHWPTGVPIDAGYQVIATDPLSAALVLGGEARVECLRVGIRSTLPMGALADLPAAGQQLADAWQSAQVQVSLGIGF